MLPQVFNKHTEKQRLQKRSLRKTENQFISEDRISEA
jgi:hypothetical protein